MGSELRGRHRASQWTAALVGVGLCAQAAATAPMQITTAPPATTTPPNAAHLTLPEAPEKRLIEQHCLACHDIVRVENAGGSRSGWNRRLRRMITRGSTLPLQDVPTVAAYLARALPERLRVPEPDPQQSGPKQPEP